MIGLPAPRASAPLALRPAAIRTTVPVRPAAPALPAAADAEGAADWTGGRAAGDGAPDLAEALAKVKTPADDEVAKQQQEFDRLMQLRAENEREMNVIREFGLAQMKKEDEFLTAIIRMI